jgi:hypothetical protein
MREIISAASSPSPQKPTATLYYKLVGYFGKLIVMLSFIDVFFFFFFFLDGSTVQCGPSRP